MDFSDIVNGFVSVDYSFLDALSQTITVNIDGAANTGSVAYSGGNTDTFVDVANPPTAAALAVGGWAFIEPESMALPSPPPPNSGSA
ncbi:hypothetical protein [Rhodophyticola sp.]|uniref:hypothetical protein n=1 Tax=Rhodophyticola sp. TaxID=2680032 RepID=UPI003D272DDB